MVRNGLAGQIAAHRGRRLVTGVAPVLLVLAGCAAVPSPAATGSPTAASTGPANHSTSTPGGPVPASCWPPSDTSVLASGNSGPAARLVTVTLTAEPFARPGGELAVTTRLLIRADGPRVILRPARSALILLREGALVARVGGPPGPDVPLQLRAGATRDAQVVPGRLPLVGCDGQPLSSGDYTLTAVVGYGEDALNPGAQGVGGAFALVSDPLTVTLG